MPPFLSSGSRFKIMVKTHTITFAINHFHGHSSVVVIHNVVQRISRTLSSYSTETPHPLNASSPDIKITCNDCALLTTMSESKMTEFSSLKKSGTYTDILAHALTVSKETGLLWQRTGLGTGYKGDFVIAFASLEFCTMCLHILVKNMEVSKGGK